MNVFSFATNIYATFPAEYFCESIGGDFEESVECRLEWQTIGEAKAALVEMLGDHFPSADVVISTEFAQYITHSDRIVFAEDPTAEEAASAYEILHECMMEVLNRTEGS